MRSEAGPAQDYTLQRLCYGNFASDEVFAEHRDSRVRSLSRTFTERSGDLGDPRRRFRPLTVVSQN